MVRNLTKKVLRSSEKGERLLKPTEVVHKSFNDWNNRKLVAKLISFEVLVVASKSYLQNCLKCLRKIAELLGRNASISPFESEGFIPRPPWILSSVFRECSNFQYSSISYIGIVLVKYSIIQHSYRTYAWTLCLLCLLCLRVYITPVRSFVAMY